MRTNTYCSNHLCLRNKTSYGDGEKSRKSVERQNHCVTRWLLHLESAKALQDSRLLQWCYNGWWLIEIAVLNCIMSVRWWDHDHGKETRQRLIFHSGSLSLKVISSAVATKPVRSHQITQTDGDKKEIDRQTRKHAPTPTHTRANKEHKLCICVNIRWLISTVANSYPNIKHSDTVSCD